MVVAAVVVVVFQRVAAAGRVAETDFSALGEQSELHDLVEVLAGLLLLSACLGPWLSLLPWRGVRKCNGLNWRNVSTGLC